MAKLLRQTLDLSFRGTRAATLFRRNCGVTYTRSCKIVNCELRVCICGCVCMGSLLVLFVFSGCSGISRRVFFGFDFELGAEMRRVEL